MTAWNSLGLGEPPPEDTKARIYRGKSMLGTFCPGDFMTIEPAAIGKIRPGDVVIFRRQDSDAEPDEAPEEVVHRVVMAAPEGLVTRGDNNLLADTTLVTEDDLLGRVTEVERDGRRRRIWGGRWGRLHPQLIQRRRVARWYTRRAISALGRVPYRWLRRSGLVDRLWQPSLIRLRVPTPDGPLIKYVHDGQTVGRWWPETDEFQCRKPYDLIIARPANGQPSSPGPPPPQAESQISKRSRIGPKR